ncbi:CASP-like protein 4D1 [Lycium barbarum]|uniref:CASP-like protein 4D1 n=1 Tax=Lycium barbarum TaxID=112863 RepID=UPI00293E8B48|nr:CASP-like protein 4D1 [Lycium barbarum]
MEDKRIMGAAILLLRIITMILCYGTVPLMINNSFELSGGEKTKYSDIKAYRYVLAAAVGAVAYSFIQLPCAMYYACTGNRLIHGRFLVMLDFYVDKVLTFLMASGVGMGYGVSSELKHFLNGMVDNIESSGIDAYEELRTKSQKFFDKGTLATNPLLAGFSTMVLLTILTSFRRK